MRKRWIWIVCILVVPGIFIYHHCTEKKLSIQTNIHSYSTLSSSIQGITMDVFAKNLDDVEYYWTTNQVLIQLQDQYIILESYETNDMEIIPYEAIENYIEDSVDLCIKELSWIREKKCSINPEELYVNK